MSKAEFRRRYKDSEAASTDFDPPGGWLAPSWVLADDVVVAEAWQVELEEKSFLMYRGRPAPDPDDADDYSTPRARRRSPDPAPRRIEAADALRKRRASLATGGRRRRPAPARSSLDSPARSCLGNPPRPPRPLTPTSRAWSSAAFTKTRTVPEGFRTVTSPTKTTRIPSSSRAHRRNPARFSAYDTNGHEILGKPKPWAGKYIPIVPVYGEEKVVEGKTILESAIRFALDPQQLYNFYKTTEAEVVQQTPKNPYVGVLGQFKTMQTEWSEANRMPRAYLEYDPVSVAGQLAPPPQRQAYEPATQALTIGAAAANEDIKATTGLFDPSRGAATPNADSGFAIDLLQQQGATATYHFFDNFMRSMWFGYRLLVDLIPRIYDTPRVIRIVRPDDVAEMVQIGRMFTGKDGKKLRYDLAQGTYAVVLSVQPSYATRKMRAAAELTQLAKADPQQLPQWADLFVRQLDIGPLGDEIAERLTPPQYAKNQPNPQQVQQQAAQLAQQNQMLQQQITELSNVLATKSYETQAKNEMNERDNETKKAIASMQEETKRMSQATSMAIAEIETKVQTVGRTMADVLATLRDREAMAHEIALKAHTRAIGIHDASELPPGMPGAARRIRTRPLRNAGAPPPQQIPPGQQPGA